MSFSLFGDIKRIVRSQRLEAEGVTTIFGDVKLDLTKTALEPGDHTLRVITLFGDVKLRVPERLGITIDAVNLFGEVEVETQSSGEEEKPGASWQSENYHQAGVRVRLHVVSLFGDLDVVRMPTADVSAVEAPQLAVADLPPRPVSYEGETSRLDRSHE
ncbi:MAG TPA: cell wall-active antibiotics response protein LiaF [Chloroflexaceae bacterium]|nr:cell wall-active antibiotics response protein LiaF [Chloroflexaceae bacterium]